MNSQQLVRLKDLVIAAAQHPEFRHHAWYVQYHLEVVSGIATECLDRYNAADRNLVEALVWLHDYEKFIDYDNQYSPELTATRKLLTRIGVSADTSEILLAHLNVFNARKDIQNAAIEVQIVCSADAGSHMVGPFYALYWYENSTVSMEQLMQDNIAKNEIDWEQKLVLPELRAAFAERHRHINEMFRRLPKTYL